MIDLVVVVALVRLLEVHPAQVSEVRLISKNCVNNYQKIVEDQVGVQLLQRNRILRKLTTRETID